MLRSAFGCCHLAMIMTNCPKCGTWLMASEVAVASGYLRCGVCTLVYPVPVLKPVGGLSKLGGFGKWTVAGAISVGILVSIARLWRGDHSPGVPIKHALSLSARPLAPLAATLAIEPAVGDWRSEYGNGDTRLFGIGQDWGALMVRQRTWQQGERQQLEGLKDR